MRINLRSTKIVAAILIIIVIGSLSVGCIGKSNSGAPATTQTATVERGSISIYCYRHR